MEHLDCACVIHGDFYDWIYVDRLYNMLTRHVSRAVTMHVWAEPTRSVPSHMQHHAIKEWPGFSGPKRAWWYKMQMFDRAAGLTGPVLYLDLDTVIVGDLDWINSLDLAYFWAVKDFRYLWRPTWTGMNSSMMFWNAPDWHWIWDDFDRDGPEKATDTLAGDQDYLGRALKDRGLRFFNPNMIRSWRWQINHGGFDPRTQTYADPSAGAVIDPMTRVIVFHGDPKPAQLQDPLISRHWC